MACAQRLRSRDIESKSGGWAADVNSSTEDAEAGAKAGSEGIRFLNVS